MKAKQGSQVRWAVPVLVALCLAGVPAQAKYSGGTGEPNDPYQIATAADLIALGSEPNDYDKQFILTADIDLDPSLPGRKVFDKAVIPPASPTGTYPYTGGTPFIGVFDGNGHTISNLTIRGEQDLGLFGQLGVGAAVKNVGVLLVDVKSSASGDCVGGLVGSNGSNSWDGGTVTRCYATGAVSGRYKVGGLVGWNVGTISNCYSTVAVTGNDAVGGLVGSSGIPMTRARGGRLYQCYSAGSVSGQSQVGGLAGTSCGEVADCFWDTETAGQTTSAAGTGKSTAEMQDPNALMAAGWDFVGQPDGPDDIWAEPPGGGYPILWWQLSPLPELPTFSGGTGELNDPYRISTPAELNRIGHNPRLMDAHFELISDVDLEGIDFHIIGTEIYPFTGFFNGNSHVVSHLTVTGSDYLGLWGYSEGEVKNLGVVDANIVGSGWYVGALVGSNCGTVTCCYSTGVISAVGCVGGLVGNNRGIVGDCFSMGAVSGPRYVGGLVGYDDWGGSITECYSVGVLNGKYEVGGLVGGGSAGGLTACFWDTQTSGQATSAGGTGKTTVELQTAKTFLDAGWDFVGETVNGTEDLWWILEGKDYPHLWYEVLPTTRNVVEVNEADFDQAIAVSMPVLVHFYATGCPGCTMMTPVLNAIADEYVDRAKVCRVDIDHAPDLAHQLGVTTVPTFILFENGVEEKRWEGVTDKQELTTEIDRMLSSGLRPDQTNLPPWAGGWTLLWPKSGGQATMWQTFTPSATPLTAVDIDIITGNPGNGDDLLTVEIAKEGAILASAVQSVKDGYDGLVRFPFESVVTVTIGESYELRVSTDGATFGWRYGGNTYEGGMRYFASQPKPSHDWFFQTYSPVAGD